MWERRVLPPSTILSACSTLDLGSFPPCQPSHQSEADGYLFAVGRSEYYFLRTETSWFTDSCLTNMDPWVAPNFKRMVWGPFVCV